MSKNRNPKNQDDLKKFKIEEWNKFPKKYIQNQFKNFIRRCKKIIELKGGRLEQIYLKQIKNEEKEENEEEEGEEEEEGNINKLKTKLIFNEEKLKKILEEEITLLRKKIKASDRELEIRSLRFRIARLKKMKRRNEMVKYFECFKAKCDLKEEERTKALTDDDK